ncbi:MAG: hypothetical protein IJD81_11990, partial [Oscillospiraceae bacterium]|nr:hypothetical protein [Oscillospiraceae bacterium]
NPFGLSRTIFESFTTFYFRPRRSARSNFIIVTQLETLVNNYFHFFQSFFVVAAPFRDSFAIIAPHPPFVKHFFQLF